MSSVELIRREIQRAAAGARHAFRAVLSSLRLDTRIQRVGGEGLAGEDLEERDFFQQFGFTSAPPAGTQVIVVPVGGRSAAAVVIASEHGSYRVVLDAAGEAAVYNQWGDFIHLRQDRTIHVVAQTRVLIETEEVEMRASRQIKLTSPDVIVAASNRVELATPATHASGDVIADRDISDAGGKKSMAGMRATYGSHKHPENDRGGPTGNPLEPM